VAAIDSVDIAIDFINDRFLVNQCYFLHWPKRGAAAA